VFVLQRIGFGDDLVGEAGAAPSALAVEEGDTRSERAGDRLLDGFSEVLDRARRRLLRQQQALEPREDERRAARRRTSGLPSVMSRFQPWQQGNCGRTNGIRIHPAPCRIGAGS
jgi:hypothetical protein